MLTEVLIVVERPASILTKPSQTSLDLIMSTIPGNGVLKEKENQKLWNLLVNHDVECVEKENGDELSETYWLRKGLLLKYVQRDSGREWAAKQSKGLDVWLRWSCGYLNLYIPKKKEDLIPNSGEGFLITGVYCLGQCGHTHFEIVAPARNPSFFTKVTWRECNSLCIYPRSSKLV